jgi:hypothetical protein
MLFPLDFPLISFTRFNSDKCLETVEWANGSTSRISPQDEAGSCIKNYKIFNSSGFPIAFNMSAKSLILNEKPYVLVIPISLSINLKLRFALNVALKVMQIVQTKKTALFSSINLFIKLFKNTIYKA